MHNVCIMMEHKDNLGINKLISIHMILRKNTLRLFIATELLVIM